MISIIIPTYNGEEYLYSNLESIKNLKSLNLIELIVIDNNSKDNTIQFIEDYSKFINIVLIKNNKNVGFAKACNIGVKKANGDYIFITNQDVIFPSSFFLKLLKKFEKYNQDNTAFSPAIIFKNKKIHYFGAKNHFLGFSYTPEILQPLPKMKIIKPTSRISGGALFIKKHLFLEIGGFDEKLFMYYEDTDFSFRMLRSGKKMFALNDPYIIHLKHDFKINNFQYYLLERNRFLLLIKNVSFLKKILPFITVIEIMLFIHSLIIKKSKLRIALYYELIKNRKMLRNMRYISSQKSPLIPYFNLSRTLDPMLLIGMNKLKVFVFLLKILNVFLKII